MPVSEYDGGSVEVNISQFIRNLIKDIGKTPYDINNSECDYFADHIITAYPKAQIRTSEDYEPEMPVGHVWVEYHGRHYDAECPNGVKNPLNLPIFRRVLK